MTMFKVFVGAMVLIMLPFISFIGKLSYDDWRTEDSRLATYYSALNLCLAAGYPTMRKEVDDPAARPRTYRYWCHRKNVEVREVVPFVGVK